MRAYLEEEEADQAGRDCRAPAPRPQQHYAGKLRLTNVKRRFVEVKDRAWAPRRAGSAFRSDRRGSKSLRVWIAAKLERRRPTTSAPGGAVPRTTNRGNACADRPTCRQLRVVAVKNPRRICATRPGRSVVGPAGHGGECRASIL
jgi:hypothetical protein